MIKVSNLSVSYETVHGYVTPIKDLSFDIEDGEVLGVIGRSGAGKTTLIKVLMGHMSDNMNASGQIYFNGNIYFDDGAVDRRTIISHMTYVPQFTASALSPSHKLGNVFKDLYCARYQKVGHKKTNQIFRHSLQELDLPEYVLNCYPHELSGGMLQRAIIAMLIALPSELVVLDEPTSALDGTSQEFLKKAITSSMIKPTMSTILISHEMSFIEEMCTSVLVIGSRSWWIGEYSKIPQQYIDEIGITQ